MDVKSGAGGLALAALLSLAQCMNPDQPVDSDRHGLGRRGSPTGVGGRVTDPDARPVSGAWIQPAALDSPSPAIPEMAVVTDERGRYFWQLPPGRYELRASARGRREARAPVLVEAGRVSTVDLVLAPEVE